MDRAGGLTVDGDLSIGHDTFKVDEDGLVPPGRRRGKGALVDAVSAGPTVRRIGPAVFVDAEALQLPVGRDTDGGPLVGIHALVAHEFPLDRVVLAQTGQILGFSLRSSCC